MGGGFLEGEAGVEGRGFGLAEPAGRGKGRVGDAVRIAESLFVGDSMGIRLR